MEAVGGAGAVETGTGLETTEGVIGVGMRGGGEVAVCPEVKEAYAETENVLRIVLDAMPGAAAKIENVLRIALPVMTAAYAKIGSVLRTDLHVMTGEAAETENSLRVNLHVMRGEAAETGNVLRIVLRVMTDVGRPREGSKGRGRGDRRGRCSVLGREVRRL